MAITLVLSACGPTATPVAAPAEPSATEAATVVPSPAPTDTPQPAAERTNWKYEREGEQFDESTVGEPGERSEASGGIAYLRLGCINRDPWTAQTGYVKFNGIEIPASDHLFARVRYSKHSQSTVTVQILLDDERVARAKFTPEDQGSWNTFVWTEPIDLGAVTAGAHSIRFATEGQQFGTLDLDKFVLTLESVVNPTPVNPAPTPTAVPDFSGLPDDDFLDVVSHSTFDFFWKEADPDTGIIKDRAANFSEDDYDVGSIASVGFGLSAICIGQERGWITEAAAYNRALTALKFFRDNMENVHGFYYHFVQFNTGERVWESEVSTIDTALFMAGALTVGQCFPDTEVQQIANELYERMDWPWALTNDGAKPDSKLITMGFTPEKGFIPARWNSYSELMIIYLLAIGSPTHPIPPESWTAWKRPEGEYAGYKCIAGGPLFMHQYSHAWVDFKDKKDSLGYDYFENSVNCTLANRQFAIDNKEQFDTYDDDVWGLTASDTPSGGYTAYGAPPGQVVHDGTVNPSAPAGSIIFTPELSTAALRAIYARYGQKTWGRYGFSDAFNVDRDWWDKDVIGIDTGITLLMIENYRTGLIQRLFMSHPAIPKAMEAAGFVQK